MKKIIAIATALTVVGMVAGPGPAAALTADELQAQITALLAQLSQLQAQLSTLQGGTGTVPAACSGITFSRTLSKGSSGSDVKCLQALLNQSTDTQVAASGAGSPGNETTYFGGLTKAAVVKFQEKYASEILTPIGLTAGTGFVGSKTIAKLNAILGGATPSPSPTASPTPTPGAGLTIALASDTPASATIVGTQALANLAKFTFTNGDATEVKITQLKLKRLGVSADTTLSNVYLFDGATRLTDAASVSSGVITLSDSSGLFKVGAGASKTITVSSDIANVSGQTTGVGINAAADVVTNASAVNGTFPINGNLMSIATGGLATVAVNANTTPTAAYVDPQNDYTVWQNIIVIGTRAVNFTRFSLLQRGSVKSTDLQNFRLYVDGTQVGSAVANLDANGYVTFDLSASPKRLEAGARTVKVLADIINGSSFNFILSLRGAVDANFIDTQYNVNVLPSGTFPAESGTQTINSGTLTITKMTDSPSSNVIDGATAVTLAKYQLKAAGEKVKVESLKVAVVTNTAGVSYLRNGNLLANDVQIGSTADLDTTTYDANGTTYNLGSSLIVEPGSPVVLKVVADIFDNDGSNGIVANTTTLKSRILAGSSNAYGVVSKTYISTSLADGNQLTVKKGALTLAKYAAYSNQAVVPPKTGYKIGAFTLTANTVEAVNLTTIDLDFTATGSFDASSDLSNLYLKFTNSAGTEVLTTTGKSTVTDSNNGWSVNYALASGISLNVDLYADIGDSAGSASTDNIYGQLRIDGITATSATAVYGTSDGTNTGTNITGQVVACTTGTLTASVAGDTPAAQLAVANQTITAAKFKWTAVGDNFTLKDVTLTVANSAVINNAQLKDGTTVLATEPFDETTQTEATFTNVDVSVPNGTSKTLTVALSLKDPLATYDESAINVKVTLGAYKKADSTGAETDVTTTCTSADCAGNNLYAYKSVPTLAFTGTATGNAIINGSEADLYKFTVKADANNDIALKQLKFNVAWSDGGTTDTLVLGSWKLYRGSTDLTSLASYGVTIQNTSGTSVESSTNITESDSSVVVTFDDEELVGKAETVTYTLKATPDGFRVLGTVDTASDSVTIRLVGDTSKVTYSGGLPAYPYLNAGTTVTSVAKLFSSSTADASAVNKELIWSDYSNLSHSSKAGSTSDSTNDWYDSYLVSGLPLSTCTWSK